MLGMGLERVAELRLSASHERSLKAQGGVEHGAGHYPWMVALHTALLAGCLIEPVVLKRRFRPSLLIGVAAAQALRWWCISSLGERWCTKVVVPPGKSRVTGGPYRFLRHPNYLAVVLEGLCLPLAHSAWITAVGFTGLNAALLAIRIRCEDAALS
ncbi:MAG: isoprenylcysteine carboxyl methyltransferase family protein [Candidatus Xenobia bacterium]